MNDDMPDLFRKMDAMMAHLMERMEAGSPACLPSGIVGYRIVIHGGGSPPDISGTGIIQPRDAKEPVPEVHHIGNEVKVIVELPGVTEDSVRLALQDSRLVIDAGDADRHYHTSTQVPRVDPASLQKTLRNGVLEITFMALPQGPESSESSAQ